MNNVLLELLHSEAPEGRIEEGPAQKEAVGEMPKNDAVGPLSGIGLFIKKLTGKP